MLENYDYLTKNPEFEKARLRILFQQNRYTQLSSIAIAAIYIYACEDFVSHPLLIIWGILFIALSFARLLFSLYFTKKFSSPKSQFDPRKWEMAFIGGVTLSGLMWAHASLYLLPINSVALCAIMGFVLAGITAGASGAYCLSRVSSQVFLLTSVVPFLFRLVLADDSLCHSMAAMVVCYLLVYSALGKCINQYAVSSIKLGFEKDKLLHQAERHADEMMVSQAKLAAALQTTETIAQSLAKSEDNMKEAQKVAHVGSFEINIVTGESHWSDELYRIFELDPKDVTASRAGYYSLLHPEDLERSKREVDNLVRTGKAYDGDRRIITTSGKAKAIFTRAIPEFNEAKQVVFIRGVVVDITDRKKSELALAQNFKMSALGEMAGGIAHEINSPLTIISMRAAQLKNFIEGDAFNKKTAAAWAEKIESTAFRIAKIIKGMRTFSRGGGDQDPFENVSASEIVNDTLALCQERFHLNQVQLMAEIQDNCQVECRQPQICQTLLALLSNAFDAVQDLPERWVKISVVEKNEFLEIAVSDSGSGIAPEIQDKILEPFFTTKEVGKGMGLGLSISKGIIDAHHGSLELDKSSPHTRFVITLPKHQKQQAA